MRSGDSSSEEEEEKGAPSILTEIEAGSRQILERAAAADRSLSSGAKKRPGETPTERNKKRLDPFVFTSEISIHLGPW